MGGAYGTLSEIALARACGRSVVVLRTWELNEAGHPETIHATATPVEAVALALRLAGRGAVTKQ
jgi:hypothetical protein